MPADKLPVRYRGSHYKCKQALNTLKMSHTKFFSRKKRVEMLSLGSAREKLKRNGFPKQPSELVSVLAKEISKQFLLRRETYRDNLTGLYNMRYLSKIWCNKIKSINNDATLNKTVACIMLDIDFFKRVNDTYGHQIGNNVLIQFANILQQKVRSNDIVIRYGGEEFCIFFFGETKKNVMKVARRIRKTVSKTPYQRRNGTEINYTTSIGVCCKDFSQLFTADEEDILAAKVEILINEADTALYKAKKTGKNKVVLASNLKNI